MRCVDHGSLRKSWAGDAYGYYTSRFQRQFHPAHGSTDNLLNLLVNPGCRLPLKKYVLGSTSGVVIQVLDEDPFSKISDAHKDMQLSIAKTDGVRDIATQPALQPL